MKQLPIISLAIMPGLPGISCIQASSCYLPEKQGRAPTQIFHTKTRSL